MRVVNSFTIQVSTNSNSMTPSTKNTKKVILPKVPRGLRSLPIAASSSDSRSEYKSLQAEAARIEEWWASPRWRLTKRVYSGKIFYLDFSLIFYFGGQQ
jgi:hypothetical protein